MRSATLGFLALLVLASAGGCGQKGPLYLPDRARGSVPAAPSPAPTPAAAPAAPAAPAASPDAGH